MKRRITVSASGKIVSIRCTEREFSLWSRLAKNRGKFLSDMVRDGLNKSVLVECLCVPGEEICEKCRLAKVERGVSI